MPKALIVEHCKRCKGLTNSPKDLEISDNEWDGLCYACRSGKESRYPEAVIKKMVNKDTCRNMWDDKIAKMIPFDSSRYGKV